jgi:lactate dehydrogenase-like 2-hydroxyacid dehydrogenase
MATRRAGEGERELRAGRWSGWRPTHLLGRSLAGKTLGLIGFGRIAQATARKAHAAFGMQIAYHGRRRAAAAAEQETGARYFASLDALLAAADAVSLHCPGDAETFHLIDAARLARMRPSAVLINTARGPVVDEKALTEALANKRIRAAAIDVFEQEPTPPDNPLLKLDNVIVAPHAVCHTDECMRLLGESAFTSAVELANGRRPKHIVNVDALKHPAWGGKWHK